MNHKEHEDRLTSGPGAPILPGRPLRSRFVFPSDPRTRSPSLDTTVTIRGLPLSGSVSFPSWLFWCTGDLVVWTVIGAWLVAGETVLISTGNSSISSFDSVETLGVLGSRGIPSEGFFGEPPTSKSIILSEGFRGNTTEVRESVFFSVVMFSSTFLDDASGLPFWLPFSPFLGFHWGFTTPPLWKTGSNKSVSSSTTKTSPRPTEPFRFGLEGIVPSPRDNSCRWDSFCRETKELGTVLQTLWEWFDLVYNPSFTACLNLRRCDLLSGTYNK